MEFEAIPVPCLAALTDAANQPFGFAFSPSSAIVIRPIYLSA
jgi:hypothetical protein